jgi:hypothetical protein
MTTKSKLDIRITIRLENKSYSDFTSFVGWVQYMGEPTSSDESGLRNPCGWDDDVVAGLADLRITAQKDRNVEDGEWYGFSLDYRDVYNADLRRAKLMVKTLGAIERKMAKLDEQLGRPTDLADYCARCAIALGATVREPFGLWREAKTINGTHYRWADVNGLRTFLAPVSATA